MRRNLPLPRGWKRRVRSFTARLDDQHGLSWASRRLTQFTSERQELDLNGVQAGRSGVARDLRVGLRD